MSSKANEKKTIQEVYELYELEQKYKAIKKKYEDKRNRLSTSIRNFMYSKGINSFEYVKGNDMLDVKSITQKRITWDADKLEKKIGKDLAEQVIEKEYLVNNMEGLIKLLKENGVNPKEFKKFITVNKKVNQNKFNELSELGDVTLDNVKGCYELKECNGYVKINIKEILEESEDE